MVGDEKIDDKYFVIRYIDTKKGLTKLIVSPYKQD